MTILGLTPATTGVSRNWTNAKSITIVRVVENLNDSGALNSVPTSSTAVLILNAKFRRNHVDHNMS